MNGIDSKYLIDYFKKKSGKYLKLDNGKKVKLFAVVENQYRLTLTFTHGNRVLVIPFNGLYGDYIAIHIPEGLEQGLYISPIVKFDNFQSIGYALENVLINWTERKDEILDLNWEEL